MSPQQTNASFHAKSSIRKIAVVSSIVDDWGGSEELWAKSIPILQQKGFQIIFFRKRINRNNPKYIALANSNVLLEDLAHKQVTPGALLFKGVTHVSRRIYNRFVKLLYQIKKRSSHRSVPKYETQFFRKLEFYLPELVIISQGINFDGLRYASICNSVPVPYVIITQKAVEFYWPRPEDRTYMTEALLTSKRNYFVSLHNKQLTEEQFGIRLPNAELIYNPVKRSNNIIPYPSNESGYQLACVGRLFILDKGQDMLLRILAKPKWKDRPLKIAFIGEGPDQEALMALAKLLKVENVEFTGYKEDADNIWQHYHALILPSRSEGMPLVLLEAMAAARPVIVSNAGGNAELVQEGITGFIGEACQASFEDAMDRAWSNRNRWEEIGLKASEYINGNIPPCPEQYFANSIIEFLNGN